ncbi:alpha-D-glucose phosphate-specific phosphoglucomutase [Candidatus Woesearchaeota archaeon CG1_02_57_44]|nr:MAG: alpha-D-glucose phosphate-specific phosphoglucomutase [Candidatus Woesearchaeota archaeon CG1_02_57_44]
MAHHPNAGQLASPSDYADIGALCGAYQSCSTGAVSPVVFGTSGHRGTSLDGTFNESHILAITQAICDYRVAQGIDGPLYLGNDTHALSGPAKQTALEVLAANNVTVMVQEGTPGEETYVPTPAVSYAILSHNLDPGKVGTEGVADGIIITPSHNPPCDGGFKYNPPKGGPANPESTAWIQDRANELLRGGNRAVRRTANASKINELTRPYDFAGKYVEGLASVIDVEGIRASGIRILADAMGGAGIGYWGRIAEAYGLNITARNDTADPTFSFMTLDHDGQIRMDCSSPFAMAGMLAAFNPEEYDIGFGNDTDFDRHGVVTSQGLMNPNHVLAVLTDYLLSARDFGNMNRNQSVATHVGKTTVSSDINDRVIQAHGRRILEVLPGFKYFVDGLHSGQLAFAGEESAGASFLRTDGRVWTTDKDGIVPCLLAAELHARRGHSPSTHYQMLEERFGRHHYERVDIPATDVQKAALKGVQLSDVDLAQLGGDPVSGRTISIGNDAIGGFKLRTANGWVVARPSGTEDIIKIYGESFIDNAHLAQLHADAQGLVERLAGD